MSKVKFVTAADKKLPPQLPSDGPFERVMRLFFQIQELPAALPTIVTRDGEPSDPRAELTRVPRQALVVAPLLAIPAATRGSKPDKALNGHHHDDCCQENHHHHHHRHEPCPPQHHNQHHAYHHEQRPQQHQQQSKASSNTSKPPGGRPRPHPALPPPPPRLDAAGLSLPGYAPGYKDRNQDAALLMDTFLSNRQQLIAVMDGHGPEGHYVSAFVRRNLPFTFLSELIEGSAKPAGGGDAVPNSNGGSGSRGAAGDGHPSASVDRALTGSLSPLSFSTDASPDRSPSAPLAPAAGPEPACGEAAGSGGRRDGGDSDGAGASGPLARALWRTVTALDGHLARSGIDDVNSGTTAALCHLHGRRLTAAWVGDSRMVLGLPTRGSLGSGGGPQERQESGLLASSDGPPASPVGRTDGNVSRRGGVAGGSGGSWRVVWSSQDHKPELPEEAARIAAAGGRVARSVGPQGPEGPYRVWFQNQPFPGLAMSRALGDRPGREIGIISAPSCATLELPECGPAVLVLASDGVWELLGDQQVLQLAAGAGSAAEAASRVVHQSRRAWVKEYGGSYIDDITAVVVRFDMPPEPGPGPGRS